MPYQVWDFGPALSGQAVAINNSGEVAGNEMVNLNYGLHTFRWDSVNGKQALRELDAYPYSSVSRISDDGRAVGNSYGIHDYQGEACLWQNLTPQGLGFLDGHDSSLAYDINNAGQVVGSSSVYTQQNTRPFLWENGAMRNLGVIDALQEGAATAINDAGMVVGTCYNYAAEAQRATFWYGGVTGYLGEPAGHTVSCAYDINNLGDVVGWSSTSWAQSYACWWHQGVATNLHLDAPPEYQSGCSRATAINNSGKVVGNLYNNPSYGDPHEGQAFLWQNHSMQLLPALSGYSNWTNAMGINDQGWIAGFAGNAYNQCRAVLWIPVPEPSGMLALGSGLAGLGGVFFRRRRR
jgi:probable HAF family extracellular repeat protein